MVERATEAMEIEDVGMQRPHVVIIGAGASLAALPDGDKNGRVLPLMNNLVDVVGLNELLESHGVNILQDNFEKLYSHIHGLPGSSSLRSEIERRVCSYFSSLVLPDHATLYDHLVLSLRQKDLIASFNWDPLLFQSLKRNHTVATMPKAVFLHGGVSIGYCVRHKKSQVGPWPGQCVVCGSAFEKSPLLFPVEKKGYADEPFIKLAWDVLRAYLNTAYILTIFGYGAPVSDVEAITLMKEAWGPKYERSLEEIEIIDIKDEEVLAETWDDFIHSHHYRVCHNFYDSYIAKHPRRTCEAMWSCLMDLRPYPSRSIPRDADFVDMWEWYKDLIAAEK